MIGTLKKILIVIGVLALVFGGYLLVAPNPEAASNSALELLGRGDFDRADESLQEQRKLFSNAEFYLYKAYILRAKGKIKESDEQLQLAQKAAMPGDSGSLLEEIIINQAYNFYLEGKQEEMAESLNHAETISSKDNEWVKFFNSLKERMGQTAARSLKGWQKPDKLIPLSNWMKQEIVDNFNDFWFFLQDVRNDFIMENYYLARKKLEEHSSKATESQMEDINFLLGMIYVKEAAGKPQIASGPYYKLAFSYFDKVPVMQKRFAPDRALVIGLLNNQIDFLINEKQYQDLAFYAAVLRKWNALEETEQLQANLMVLLKEKSDGEDERSLRNIIETLDQLVADPSKREVLDRMFIDLINQALAKGHLEPADTFWEGAKLFSTNSEALSVEFANQTAQKALELIPLDDAELKETFPYLEFWTLLTKNPEVKLAFANQLLKLAPQLWIEDENPRKALQLIRVADGMVSLKQREAFQKKSDEVLAYIKQQNAEQIAKAKALYDTGKYVEAWGILVNPLKIDDKNEEAILYAGLAAYQLGDYRNASAYLSIVVKGHKEVLLPLAVSQAILGDKTKERELLEGGLKGELNQQLIIRLTLGSAMFSSPESSLVWFKKIDEKSDEALAIRFIILAMNKDWENALKNYAAVPKSYKELQGVQGLYIQTLLSLDKIEEAEKEMNTTHSASKADQTNHSFPLLFQVFVKARLNELSADYIAGLYYFNFKKDPKKALEFLEKIPNPGPQVLLQLGIVYDTLNLDEEALRVLEKALSDADEQQEIIQSATFTMALLYSENGFYYDSVIYFEKYYELAPHVMDQRSVFGKAWMEVRRYDKALEQFLLVEKSTPLPLEDQINVLECLMRTDQTAGAKMRMEAIVAGDALLAPAQKAHLGRLALMMKDQQLVNRFLKDLEKLQGNQEALESRLELELLSGEYNDAEKLVQEQRNGFQENSRGLYLLAQYYLKQGNMAEARSSISNSLKMNPKNRIAQELQEQLFNDKESIDKRIAALSALLKIHPNRITYNIDISRQYIDRAIEEHLSNPTIPVDQLVDLRQSILISEPLAKKYEIFPEIYFLLGQAYYIGDKNEEALQNLQAALKLDVSYSEAYKYLSLVLSELGKINDAIGALQKALQYSPDDGEAWKMMADAYLLKGDALSASAAISYALKYEPNNPKLYLFVGKLKLALENPEDALANLEKALKLSPNDPEILKALYATLSNAHLLRNATNPEALGKQRDEVFRILQSQNPEEADKLKQRYLLRF